MRSDVRKAIWGSAAAATLVLSAQIGHASMIAADSGASMTFGASSDSSYADSKLVLGNSASVMKLSIPSAGVLSLAWTDLDFASSLAALDLGLSDGTKNLANFLGAGSTTLDLSGPVTLYATIFATAQGSLDVGLYNVSASFVPAGAPVPVPGLGIWGLGTGFLGLLALARRRSWRRLAGRLETSVGAGLLGLLALGWRQGWRQPEFSGSVYQIVTTPMA